MGRFDDMNRRFEENDKEGGKFWKIDDGAAGLVAFLGDPHIRETFWDGSNYQDWTPGCGKSKVLKTKMNVAVFEMENGQPVYQGLQILEQGKKFFKLVNNLDIKYGVDNKVFEVRRSGTGKDTEYTILPECDITAEMRKHLAGLTLHDLADDGEGGGGAVAEKPATLATEEQLAPLLKDLQTLNAYNADIPKDFTQHFGLRKIKELTTDKLKAARSWVDGELDAMRRAQADGEGEGDPFA